MVIIIEGPSETGKTKIAKFLEKNKKFKYIKFKKPNGDYHKPEYSGPSYYDVIMDMLTNTLQSNQNVVFDRSPLSEIIYAKALDRKPLLTEDQVKSIFNFIKGGYEIKSCIILDPDMDKHWNRHSLRYNNIDKEKFNKIINEYKRLAKKYGIEIVDFSKACLAFGVTFKQIDAVHIDSSIVSPSSQDSKIEDPQGDGVLLDIDYKINMANAIKKILKSRIIKGKTEIHNILENSIRGFLNDKLSNIFQPESKSNLFTDDEINVLKDVAGRVIQKIKNGGN